MCPHLTPVILRSFSARADNPTGSDDENEHVADIQAFELEAVIAAENFEQQAKWFIPMRLRQKKYGGSNRTFLERLGIGYGDLADQLEAAGFARIGNSGAPIRQMYEQLGFELQGLELHPAAADPLLSVLYVPHATATPPPPPPVAEGSTNKGAGITTTGAATATDPSFPVEVQTEFFVTACPPFVLLT
jgi:hypothetical protein